MTEVLAHGQAVLDLVTATQALPTPPTLGLEKVKCLRLWMVKAVMSGRGNEVLHRAKTNVP